MTPTELAEENDRWARCIAIRYWRAYRDSATVSKEDLASAARLGLCRAALRYGDGPAKFTTFAWWYVLREVRNQLRNDLTHGVHVPSRKGDENRIKRLPAASMEDSPEPSAPAKQDPPDPALWERLRQYMRPEQYDALVLKFRDGQTYREAGRNLGVSGNEAFRRTREGMAMLSTRQELADELE